MSNCSPGRRFWGSTPLERRYWTAKTAWVSWVGSPHPRPRLRPRPAVVAIAIALLVLIITVSIVVGVKPMILALPVFAIIEYRPTVTNTRDGLLPPARCRPTTVRES